MSATTLLALAATERSVTNVRIAAVVTVNVTPLVETAVLSISLPSVKLAAVCKG